MGGIDRLHAWAIAQPGLRVGTVIVRVTLALAFVPSGFVKIMDEPFTTLPVSDPVGSFFAGFFSVHGYYRFVGVAQWAAGLLLIAAGVGFQGVVATHLARLRHGSYAGPLSMVAVGTLLGMAMLVTAYRRARRQ